MSAAEHYTFGPYKIHASEVFYSTPLSYAMVNLRPLLPGSSLPSPFLSNNNEITLFLDHHFSSSFFRSYPLTDYNNNLTFIHICAYYHLYEYVGGICLLNFERLTALSELDCLNIMHMCLSVQRGKWRDLLISLLMRRLIYGSPHRKLAPNLRIITRHHHLHLPSK